MGIFDIGNAMQQNNGNAWSYQKIGDTMRYELRGKDSAQSMTDRSETESALRWANNNQIHLSYDFMIEKGEKNSASWLLMGQFISAPGAGGKTWSPPFAVEMAGENMRFMVRSSTDSTITSNPIGSVVWKDSAPIERGHNYKMDIFITFDPYGNGKLTVVRDGVELFTYNGPIGYADSGGYYWKEGLYRSSNDQTIAAQFSNAEVSYINSSQAGKVFEGTANADKIWGTGGDDIIRGGAGHDKLYGHDGNDILEGGDGSDLLAGMAGADYLDGGAGSDGADYSLSSAGVTVSLATGKGYGGDAEGDTLVNIEGLHGSKFDDVLIGDAKVNSLEGNAGNDRLEGGGGGDYLYGGNGIDTAVYTNSSAGVTVSLVTGTGTGGDAQGDKLFDIENIEGSKFADKLIGNDLNNVLIGDAGNDVLNGGAGNDTLSGGAGNDVLIGGKGNDIIDGGAGNDVLVLAGNSREYTFKFLADGRVEVTDKVGGRDGVDIISNIENLAFKDGSAKVDGFRKEQITKHYDKNWAITSYDITVTNSNKDEYKQHFDKNWKLQFVESVTNSGNTQTTRILDANGKQTSVTVVTTDKDTVTSKYYDATGTKLLSTTTELVNDGHTVKTQTSASGETTSTSDSLSASRAVEYVDQTSKNLTEKYYDANMKPIGNTLVQYGDGFTDYKEYDANWQLTSFHRVMAENYMVGALYKTGSGSILPYQDVRDVLTHATDDPGYLISYGHYTGALA